MKWYVTVTAVDNENPYVPFSKSFDSFLEMTAFLRSIQVKAFSCEWKK